MKIIKSGFEILRVKSINESFNFRQFEKQHNIAFPPIYKVFINAFYVGREESLKAELYYDEKYNDKFGLLNCVYFPDAENIGLGCFFLPNESVEILNNEYEKNDEIFKLNLLPLGEDNTGHNFFMLGIGDENQDYIYMEDSDMPYESGKRIIKLANNIFEFLQNFALVEMETNIGYGYELSYEQLFKNWGEDFWRIRE